MTAGSREREPGTDGTPVPGIDATSPHRIPLAGWGQVLKRSGSRLLAERFMLLAAGVAFFAVLSIAPMLVTALSVYGAVNTPEQARAQIARLAVDLPDDLRSVVTDQLSSITAASTNVLTVGGLASLLVALWTATAAASSLLETVAIAYHEPETRGFWRRAGLALLFVLGGALLLGAVLTAVGWGGRTMDGAPGPLRAVGDALTWVLLGLLTAMVLGVVYRFAPDRRPARWRWVSWGATLATVTWVLTSAGLFAWVRVLGTYDTMYGSLAGVAISMFWLWLTVLLVVLGAVVNAEAERQTARDSTVGPDRPLGEREAAVADSVPPYPGQR